VFRFESLQKYEVEDEDMSDEGMREWWDFIIQKSGEGTLMQRVRLVIEPLTDYTRTELEIHKKSKDAGDDIRIIKGDIFNTLNINQEDFWLIDNKIVLKMNYSIHGEYTGFEVIESNIDKYLETKNLLIKNSISL
jgi:hypothetical protein